MRSQTLPCVSVPRGAFTDLSLCVSVPRGAFTEQQLLGDMDSRLAGGLAVTVLLMFLSAVLFVLLRTVRRRRLQDSDQRDTVALGKHPNVV